jgi:hypothetical protein
VGKTALRQIEYAVLDVSELESGGRFRPWGPRSSKAEGRDSAVTCLPQRSSLKASEVGGSNPVGGSAFARPSRASLTPVRATSRSVFTSRGPNPCWESAFTSPSQTSLTPARLRRDSLRALWGSLALGRRETDADLHA